MTDNTLAARLAALASETPAHDGAARILPDADPFDAILSTVDQTVLPATLQFASGTARLVLVVAGRRLSAVPGAVARLSPDDTAAIAAAAKAIAAFADTAEGPLAVTETAPPDGPADPTERVSVKAIAAAAGRELIDPDAPLPQQMRARLGPDMQAMIVLTSGKISDSAGPDDLLDILSNVAQTQLPAFVAARADRCPSHAPPALTLLAGAVGADLALGLLEAEDVVMLFALADAAIPQADAAMRISL